MQTDHIIRQNDKSINLNSNSFPVLKYMSVGFENQMIGFPNMDIKEKFTANIDVYTAYLVSVLNVDDLSFRTNYIHKNVLHIVDNVLGHSLWEQRNFVTPGSGLILTHNQEAYLYKIENETAVVKWVLFYFLGDILVHFSTGNWKHSDIKSKVLWLDNFTFDGLLNEPNHKLSYPIQMVSDLLTYRKSNSAIKEVELKPGQTDEIESTCITNNTGLNIYCLTE